MTDSFEVQTPLVTPMEEDGSVAHGELASLIDHLVSAGVDGLVPCGTTGEFTALTEEERRAVIETTVDVADGRVPVMAGVGGTAVDAVRRRIGHAADAGADSVLLVAPYFGGQASDDGNEAFFRAVLDDSPLPGVLYDIPSAAGQTLSVETVCTLADHQSVRGLKSSSGDLTAFDEAIRRTPDDFVVYQGWDAGFVPAIVMGATGGISALTHHFPDTFRDAAEAVAAGDVFRARRQQLETIDPVFEACATHGFAPAIKTVLADRGVISTDAVRPPLEPISGTDRTQLLERVR